MDALSVKEGVGIYVLDFQIVFEEDILAFMGLETVLATFFQKNSHSSYQKRYKLEKHIL